MNEKLQMLLEYSSELIQINISIWRLLYAVIEITMLVFVFLILPVWVIKMMIWSWNNAFAKNSG